MNINVVKSDDVVLESVERKTKTSKYDLVVQKLLQVKDGECVVVNTEDGQKAESLKTNIYQAIRNKIEGKKIKVRVLEKGNGVAIFAR